MTWKVDFKYTDFASDGSGTPIHVKARISNELGDVQNATLPLGSEKKSDEDIIDLVQEEFYQRTYLNRAENEKFSAVDEKMVEIEKRSKANEEKFADMEGKFKVMMGTMGDLVLKYQESLLSDEESDQEESEETHETTDNTETHEQENQGNN